MHNLEILVCFIDVKNIWLYKYKSIAVSFATLNAFHKNFWIILWILHK